MTPLDTLAPDQRAVLELVLRQGRSYGELAELLGIPERDVRARADAGLRALAGEPGAGRGHAAGSPTGCSASSPTAEAERTRAAVRAAPTREWAAAAARAGELGGACRRAAAAAAETRGAPRPRPRPLRDAAASAAPPLRE